MSFAVRLLIRQRLASLLQALTGWLAIACLTSSLAATAAENAAEPEYKVKAAMVINLTKYVDWPAGCFPQTNSPWVLGILGQNNIGDELSKMIEGRTVNGRKLVLQHFWSAQEARKAHVLFISASERKHLPEVIAQLKDTSVLTVGETESFTQAGGMINLPKKENKIRPEINLAAAEKAHLKISSKLLSVSDLFKGHPGGEKKE